MIRLRISFSKDLRQDRRRILPYPHDSSIKSGGRWCNLAINGDLLCETRFLFCLRSRFERPLYPSIVTASMTVRGSKIRHV